MQRATTLVIQSPCKSCRIHISCSGIFRVRDRRTPSTRGVPSSADAIRRDTSRLVTVSSICNWGRHQIFYGQRSGYFLPGSDYYPSPCRSTSRVFVTLKAAIEGAARADGTRLDPPKGARVCSVFRPTIRPHSYQSHPRHRGIERMLMQFAKLEGLSFLDMTGALPAVARAWRKAVLHSRRTLEFHASELRRLVADSSRGCPSRRSTAGRSGSLREERPGRDRSCPRPHRDDLGHARALDVGAVQGPRRIAVRLSRASGPRPLSRNRVLNCDWESFIRGGLTVGLQRAGSGR